MLPEHCTQHLMSQEIVRQEDSALKLVKMGVSQDGIGEGNSVPCSKAVSVHSLPNSQYLCHEEGAENIW